MSRILEWAGPTGFGLLAGAIHSLLGFAGLIAVMGASMVFYGEGLHLLKKE